MPGFDETAASFNRYRALPAEALEAIRTAVWATIAAKPGARLLDLGAGSGRIGKVFVTAGDVYIGVDLSPGMLAQFNGPARSGPGSTPLLVQAKGEYLPFADDTFDIVLLTQVLSGTSAWQLLLREAQRVVQAGGVLTLGQTVAPPTGIDAQLRAHLASLLAELQVESPAPGARREEARAWLAATAARQEHVIAARWDSIRTPRHFLKRQPTGARFAALPAAIKTEALQRLDAWAIAMFGSLDVPFTEPYTFELDVFAF
jgi:ubiquinone/menaquinone biosynthesis C-methylase UbiE